jgi:hypothetical protein
MDLIKTTVTFEILHDTDLIAPPIGTGNNELRYYLVRMDSYLQNVLAGNRKGGMKIIFAKQEIYSPIETNNNDSSDKAS